MEKTMEWQPIETAPRDGTPFFTYSDDAAKAKPLNVYGTPGTPILVMSWQPFDNQPYQVDENGDWHSFHNWEPTHWQPLDALPPPPTVGETNG
jgi:hypothetical protein